MGFWDTLGKVVKTAGQTIGQLSIIVHPEDNAIELTPVALLGVKTLVEYKYEAIEDITFSNSTITVTVEKMFMTHTLIVDEALINIDNDDVHITVHLAEGIPLLLQGIGGQIVASIINSMLGFSEDAASVNVNGKVVTYTMPKSKFGWVSQITLQHTLADTEFFVKPQNTSVLVYYPEHGIVKPELTSMFNAFLSANNPTQIPSTED